MASSDPLSFLADDDASSSDSDEETINNKGISNTPSSDYITDLSANNDGKGIVLPDPESLLSEKTKPSFYKDDDDSYYHSVDWERVSDQVYNTAKAMHKSVPTLGGSMSTNPNVVSGAAVKYSKEKNQSNDTVTAENSVDNNHASSELNEDATESSFADSKHAAKRKTSDTSVTYRQREKRKRDLGQSSRGKNYVEEEKRILKQSYNFDSY